MRKRQYKLIVETVRYRVCPFCGCELFDAPTAPSEDFDHYLDRNRYPFAAANLRNLVPMGKKCNATYKRDQDLLRDGTGTRRRAFNPYVERQDVDRQVILSLNESVAFAGKDGQTPEWHIDLHPDSPECETWDRVFHLRERIARDELDPWFKTWLEEFGAWCKSADIQTPDNPSVIGVVERYAGYLSAMGIPDRAFLKCAVFRLILKWCQDGNQHVLDVMRQVANNEVDLDS